MLLRKELIQVFAGQAVLAHAVPRASISFSSLISCIVLSSSGQRYASLFLSLKENDSF